MCLKEPFPQTVLTSESLRRNYNHLLLTEDLSPQSNTCAQLIQHYHPSLWSASIKGHKSPLEAWYCVEDLEKCIENRLKYKGTDLSPKDIRMGFSVTKIAPKVSIFRPALAKYLISKYLPDCQEVFDPCSGYSGRLLGAVVLGKTYIGQDINEVTVAESSSLIQDLHLKNCRVSCKNSLVTEGAYESLFTCPPYGDKENWNQDIEVLSSDEWIDECLKNYKCRKYLFVVDQTSKYQKYVVETLVNKSHLGCNQEYVILIPKA